MNKKILTLTIMLACTAMVAVFCGPAQAAVSGQCSGCHTMHASEGGTALGGPYAQLTLSSCVGCHTGTAVGGAPLIDGTTGASDDMCAGGTFDDTVIDNDAKVHNLAELSLSEGAESFMAAVPGLSGSAQSTMTLSNLTCAGTTGCHGRHGSGLTTSALGVAGFHHGTYDGYRYLQIGIGDPGTSVLGTGSDTWESGGATEADHNVYSASITAGISALCGNCHGGFHGTANTGTGPFTRHPTDNLFSDASGWTLVTVRTDYDAAPFAFADSYTGTTGTAYTAATTGASVSCLSCHRAHGSAQADILRWDYAAVTTQAGGGTSKADSTGCLICHYRQR